MEYNSCKKILQHYYSQFGIANNFIRDNLYLETAYKEITHLWFENFNKIREVRFVMIAEAPLWGKEEKYIYNPKTTNTQFFHKSDLEYIVDMQIKDKEVFIRKCNEIGLLFVDISPFALNPKETAINYRSMGKKKYRQLVKDTIPIYFEEKLRLIKLKKSDNVKIIFRYARVKKMFSDLLTNTLVDNQIIASGSKLFDIYQQGGGIDRQKFKNILNSP